MRFKFGELFCGPGGMALGATLAQTQNTEAGEEFSISHIWGIDKDRYAIDTYNANDLGEGIQCDAIEFCENKYTSTKTIKDFARVDALAFGFPCNDFSNVGKRNGLNGDFGNLYRAGIKAINYSDPLWFVAENVSGIHSADAGSTFQIILEELKNAGTFGYDLTVNLYKFEEYGIPQYRHRYLIVGTRKDKGIKFSVPAPTTAKNYVTAKNELSRSFEGDIYNNELTRHQEQILDRLLFTPPWKNAWYLEELLAMNAWERRKALKKLPWYDDTLKQLSSLEIKTRLEECRLHCTKAKMSHIYKRLDKNRPSYTITGSGGGGTHVYHWEENRALTNRERARLQSFPDNFEFKGPKEQVRKQIGMAVPPRGAKIIFEAILKTFAGVDYESVQSNYDANQLTIFDK